VWVRRFQKVYKSLKKAILSLNVTSNWPLNIDKGLINGVLFLDLRKAFDTVDHIIVIEKLNLYGITGGALN
jgi:hypothetical protein